MQQRRTLIVAIDLGTSATTASHVIVNDTFTSEGKIDRHRGAVSVTNVRDWPGGSNGDAVGNLCVPTDLIYSRADRKLLFWGFGAKQYLDDPFPDIEHEDIYTVQHIKLLLQNPDDSTILSSPAARRYRVLREKLFAILGKQPEEVFEDFMNEIVKHVIQSANRKYIGGISSFNIELVLAFPSGWPDFLHTKVAGIGARAMTRALAAAESKDVVFGIENIYTVSETLCGVKEWLRDSIAEQRTSISIDFQGTNLDGLSEGDCFLPVDIGGGTGCMTPLRLVTKQPLRVDQLGPTQSLNVSGEAVEAEFESWLQSHITTDDYPEDLPHLLFQICRRFKEAKKDCGLPLRHSATTWNVIAPGLHSNPAKGFGNGHIKIERSIIEKCFDPVIDLLEAAIQEFLSSMDDIKAIVFLGQFGSSSEYLRKRMAMSPISNLTTLRHSDSGKLNVVRGAMSERMDLAEKFVRKYQTMKSYGTLITLPYSQGSEGSMLFPDAVNLGAVPFAEDDGPRLFVVDWAIPKGTTLEDGNSWDLGKDTRKEHTWKFVTNTEKDREEIEFEDIIVISDETPPPPDSEGRSFTLWTEAHKDNQLIIDGQKLQIQTKKFYWDLSKSQKLDADGNLLGPYEKADMEFCWFPEEFRKGKRRFKQRKLRYDLVWEVSEMQVKVHIRPLFPNPPGPITTQPAKELSMEANDKSLAGESRSQGLERDIEVSKVAKARRQNSLGLPQKDNTEIQVHSCGLDSVQNSSNIQPVPPIYLQQQNSAAQPRTASTSQIRLRLGPHQPNTHEGTSTAATPEVAQSSPSSQSSKRDGRYRDGCFTCKLRKKKCDCRYLQNRTTNTRSCYSCRHYGLPCHLVPPPWNDAQLKAKQAEWQHDVKLAKKKMRNESNSSKTMRRGSPLTTVNPANLTLEQEDIVINMAPIAPMGFQ